MTTTQRSTFARFVIAAVATALVAWLTIAIGGRTTAGATHDGDVQLGHFNSTNSPTGIANLDAGETALDADAEGSGPGIFSTSDSGFGVQGASTTGTGVFGSGVNGVRGESFTGDGGRAGALRPLSSIASRSSAWSTWASWSMTSRPRRRSSWNSDSSYWAR